MGKNAAIRQGGRSAMKWPAVERLALEEVAVENSSTQVFALFVLVQEKASALRNEKAVSLSGAFAALELGD